MAKHETPTATGPSAQNTMPQQQTGNGSRTRHAPAHNGQAHNGQAQSSEAPTRTLTKAQPDQLMRRSALLGDPFTWMQQLADEMDAVFDGFGLGRSPVFGRWRPGFGPAAPLAQAAWAPPLEVEERDGKLLVRADLPGLKQEDVQLQLEDDVLTITGERRQEHEENRDGFYHSERSYGSFRRSIPLPAAVNPDEVQASFRDGVLEVTMPVPQPRAARGHQIAIQS